MGRRGGNVLATEPALIIVRISIRYGHVAYNRLVKAWCVYFQNVETSVFALEPRFLNSCSVQCAAVGA